MSSLYLTTHWLTSEWTDLQSQKAVTAYLTLKQLLAFDFALQFTGLQSQKAVAFHLTIKELLAFCFARQ